MPDDTGDKFHHTSSLIVVEHPQGQEGERSKRKAAETFRAEWDLNAIKDW